MKHAFFSFRSRTKHVLHAVANISSHPQRWYHGAVLRYFWDCGGIIMTDHPENGPTVTRHYCSDLLIKFRSEFVRKRRRKLSNRIIRTISRAHRAQQAVQTGELCGFLILPQSTYSPEVALSSPSFFLFPYLKGTPFP